MNMQGGGGMGGGMNPLLSMLMGGNNPMNMQNRGNPMGGAMNGAMNNGGNINPLLSMLMGGNTPNNMGGMPNLNQVPNQQASMQGANQNVTRGNIPPPAPLNFGGGNQNNQPNMQGKSNGGMDIGSLLGMLMGGNNNGGNNNNGNNNPSNMMNGQNGMDMSALLNMFMGGNNGMPAQNNMQTPQNNMQAPNNTNSGDGGRHSRHHKRR